MSLQAFYGTRNGRKQLSHKRKSIIYLLYYLDLSTGFRLGCCIQNQIYFIDSKYLHCSNNFCSCANILKLQSQISNRHLIGLYWIVFIFHQIIKGSARKKNHVFILPHRNILHYYDTYRVHVGIRNIIILCILKSHIQFIETGHCSNFLPDEYGFCKRLKTIDNTRKKCVYLFI